MLKSKIKTHKFGNKYQQEHFFILNKGNNAGKPLPEYCANCFVFIADDVNEKEFFFFLFYGLWLGGLFRPFIGGSVIPFIRLDDLIKVAEEASQKVNRQNNYESSIELLKDLESHHATLIKQIELIKQARKSLMYKMFK
jgi:hypothetical protein